MIVKGIEVLAVKSKPQICMALVLKKIRWSLNLRLSNSEMLDFGRDVKCELALIQEICSEFE